MLRLWLLVPAALVAVVLLPAAGRADNPTLTGDVGLNDSFIIGLIDASGARVTHLEPGTYTLVVHDHSDIHNFHLFGPGVTVATDIGGTGDSTFTIALTDGTYNYVCDAHATFMKGSFTVGTPPAPPSPVAAKLSASVGPGSKIAVRGVVGLSAGRAVIVVKDASRTDNFHLVGPGVNKATGVMFRGTVTWKVTLKPGSYSFRSDRHKTLRGAFRVAASG
jgi:hypothetical protein